MTVTEAKQVFSPKEDFVYLGADKEQKRTADLIQSLRRRDGKFSHLDEAVNHWFKTRTERPGG